MSVSISDRISVYQTQCSQRDRKTLAAQGALRILSETGKSGRDSLSISNSAKSFSKESIAALIDKNANVSASELSFYFANYNNSSAILGAINFGENVSCGYNPNFKDYGVMDFDYNGSRQVVPNYAVPKINASSLSGIRAVNNSLVLNNKSYYSWTTSSGSRYPGRPRHPGGERLADGSYLLLPF